MHRLSVVIPVYNEAPTIQDVVTRVREAAPTAQIIVVDDGSTDGTGERLEQIAAGDPDIRVLTHQRNRGKGAALRTAFEEVSREFVIIQDGDLEYNPNDYARMLRPLIEGQADVVYGSRFLGGPHRVLFFWHYVGNKLLTLLSNMLTNLNLTDMETGYKAFRRQVVESITLRSNRFGFEPEFTAKVAKKKFRIFEVPIEYYGRTYDEGKKITWIDGMKALFIILWFRVAD